MTQHQEAVEAALECATAICDHERFDCLPEALRVLAKAYRDLKATIPEKDAEIEDARIKHFHCSDQWNQQFMRANDLESKMASLRDRLEKAERVVEAAGQVMKSEVIKSAPYAGYSEALLNLGEALADLDGGREE